MRLEAQRVPIAVFVARVAFPLQLALLRVPFVENDVPVLFRHGKALEFMERLKGELEPLALCAQGNFLRAA